MSTPAQTPPSDSPEAWLTRQMELMSVSVREMASRLGVTEKSVYDWRRGKTPISESRIPAVAEVLGVTEVEARRGLGYWVPDGTEPGPAAIDREELLNLKRDLQDILDRIDRLQG